MKLTKKEIARRQINTALELFFEKKDILSILTLAGAGEEIIGKLLERSGKPNSIADMTDYAKESLGVNVGKKIISKIFNNPRNKLKHANNPDEDEAEIKFDDMLLMLSRAVVNYDRLDNDRSPLMVRFFKDFTVLSSDPWC